MSTKTAGQIIKKDFNDGMKSGMFPDSDNDRKAQDAANDPYCPQRIKSYWLGYAAARGIYLGPRTFKQACEAIRNGGNAQEIKAAMIEAGYRIAADRI